MTRHELDELIQQGEHSRLEFKRQLSSAAQIARTLAAFANTSGGTLLIGVADTGKLIGVSSEFREIATLEEATDRFIEPALSVSYKTLAPDGRIVLIVTILESDEKPHYVIQDKTKRTIYVRAKDKSVPTNQLIHVSLPADAELLQSPTVRTLRQYLRKNEHITADRFAKLVNISSYRASKLLRQLADRGFLLLVDKSRPVRYVLKQGE
ncbi:AlbA family DNA-binding domain-containing protein [Spirosoma panaciterrae]|uniref:AlbA family DNA-binding domain-containing protein n=1 Tax=Spirosoma panaciterrae TaxID=496058 RepID=UPI000361ACFA|nr:ATP-binding protein [Spirosoma panaciterrae]